MGYDGLELDVEEEDAVDISRRRMIAEDSTGPFGLRDLIRRHGFKLTIEQDAGMYVSDELAIFIESFLIILYTLLVVILL
jgi:hypothetical protein